MSGTTPGPCCCWRPRRWGGRLVDAASVLPVLAAVPPAVLSGTDTANVVELADPLEPQAVLTRLRAAATAPGPLTVYVTGQLLLDRRQRLPHLALARTTASTARYTAFPWHWFREELRLRPPGATTLILDLYADPESWQALCSPRTPGCCPASSPSRRPGAGPGAARAGLRPRHRRVRPCRAAVLPPYGRGAGVHEGGRDAAAQRTAPVERGTAPAGADPGRRGERAPRSRTGPARLRPAPGTRTRPSRRPCGPAVTRTPTRSPHGTSTVPSSRTGPPPRRRCTGPRSVPIWRCWPGTRCSAAVPG
ncbi:hypothetical protein ACR6C2_24000 [Streptomyces sp. INA 01156]